MFYYTGKYKDASLQQTNTNIMTINQKSILNRLKHFKDILMLCKGENGSRVRQNVTELCQISCAGTLSIQIDCFPIN